LLNVQRIAIKSLSGASGWARICSISYAAIFSNTINSGFSNQWVINCLLVDRLFASLMLFNFPRVLGLLWPDEPFKGYRSTPTIGLWV
jgi:hypothetical protein